MSRPVKLDKTTRDIARQVLYHLSTEAWSRRELDITLDGWQAKAAAAPPGSRTVCLVHRQAGKTTAGSVGVAHTMIYRSPGATNLVLAPTQKQSAEFVRRLRQHVLKTKQTLKVDNTFGIELGNGSRCLAMPGQDDASIRGLTIDGGDLVIDEAARVDDALYDAARPMLIRYAGKARLMLLSTAWAKQGFFYNIWAEGNPKDWLHIEAKLSECRHISREEIEREKRNMSAAVFAREYSNVFDSLESRFFDLASIDAAFGAVTVPTPPAAPTNEDPDPVVTRHSFFSGVPA
jgi:hypothetical protein